MQSDIINVQRLMQIIRKLVIDMGMTNKQFQGFIRLSLSSDNEKLLELKSIFQSMLEDGD